jgi:septal ring factor EnvC (AmiA/AmiB activator)
LTAELETRVAQLKALETDLKNLFYREQEARQVLEYDYKELAYECDKHMEHRIALDRDLVNYYKSLQKLNEDCEKLRAQLKELEEAALPIARLLVPHPGGPKIALVVDRLKEAPSRLAVYVKHLAKTILNQVLAFMKSYFPKGPMNEEKLPSMSTRCRDLGVRSPIMELSRVVVLDSSPVEGGRQ